MDGGGARSRANWVIRRRDGWIIPRNLSGKILIRSIDYIFGSSWIIFSIFSFSFLFYSFLLEQVKLFPDRNKTGRDRGWFGATTDLQITKIDIVLRPCSRSLVLAILFLFDGEKRILCFYELDGSQVSLLISNLWVNREEYLVVVAWFYC